ncbi:hypothetical protein COV82_05630 [Candidatus Peregrinibacteria bacterium CG11_big_fil_rev_8_21_14_0_20_46_8]|nr:MAG: hypothetical protein COV82_05630 [Candidatus Peregrinibacteria bacterium CG11_big_fil_rev_8_21_14_0_20_46_8]
MPTEYFAQPQYIRNLVQIYTQIGVLHEQKNFLRKKRIGIFAAFTTHPQIPFIFLWDFCNRSVILI